MDYKKFLQYVELVARAHTEYPNKFGRPMRKLPNGDENPYFTHSLWCAMMILMEPQLPENIRVPGALALLFHDILEDTTIELPSDLTEEVKNLVQEMTISKDPEFNYSGFEKERTIIFDKPIIIQLLKLYDKTATLYDGDLSERRYKDWTDFTEELAQNVEKEYGKLNIVLLAEQLIQGYRAKINNT